MQETIAAAACLIKYGYHCIFFNSGDNRECKSIATQNRYQTIATFHCLGHSVAPNIFKKFYSL